MSPAAIASRAEEVARMERAIDEARRALTLAEIDLLFGIRGDGDRIETAKRRFCEVAEILNGGSKQ